MNVVLQSQFKFEIIPIKTRTKRHINTSPQRLMRGVSQQYFVRDLLGKSHARLESSMNYRDMWSEHAPLHRFSNQLRCFDESKQYITKHTKGQINSTLF